ncbi:hypothetical protein EV184_1286 [Sinorhizobium americanum]|uniref:Uncharacterized protein n=2 Tax=Sinorhizobium americanum TaxID=194963 RepID=A0A4R2B2Q2_9HYPH|nr:hypothetical protein EV184_1286 [Sinorhizobium americanum]
MQNLVAYALPFSMGRNAADLSGNRKLGQVFLALMDDPLLSKPIKRYIVFCLLIRSKPAGWLNIARKYVSAMKRDDLYLRHMLHVAIKQFKEEINTEAERLELKELIASVRLRREVNIKVPSTGEIKRTIGKLDAGDFWDEGRSEVS